MPVPALRERACAFTYSDVPLKPSPGSITATCIAGVRASGRRTPVQKRLVKK